MKRKMKKHQKTKPHHNLKTWLCRINATRGAGCIHFLFWLFYGAKNSFLAEFSQCHSTIWGLNSLLHDLVSLSMQSGIKWSGVFQDSFHPQSMPSAPLRSPCDPEYTNLPTWSLLWSILWDLCAFTHNEKAFLKLAITAVMWFLWWQANNSV